jgi:hypothetical protein
MPDKLADVLPPVTAIRAYMRATGWAEGPQGSHGSVFTKGEIKVCVMHEDDDPDAVRMALYRLAQAEERSPDETAAAVLAHRAETVPAGSVPDDTGRDLPSAHANAQDRPGPVHRPGPKRMVARQVAPSDCLACGQRWPCEASWQARAERAEARLAEVRAVLLEGGQGDGTVRCRAIAIVGTEGAGNGE